MLSSEKLVVWELRAVPSPTVNALTQSSSNFFFVKSQIVSILVFANHSPSLNYD